MNGNIITKRDIRGLTYDIPRFILIVIIVVFVPPYIAQVAYGRDAGHNANVRDVQLLLFLKGYNPGPIDGKCREQTQSAIEKFKGTLANIPSGTSCNTQFLESMKAHLITSLSTATSVQPNIPSQSVPEQHNIESLAAEVSNLKADLRNAKENLAQTISAVKGLNEGISTQFVTLVSSMNNMWVTTILTGFAILATIYIAYINFSLKKRYDDIHADLRGQLQKTISIAEKEVSAKIYTLLASHSINLYKDFEHPEPASKHNQAGRHNKLYNSYLEIAATMAEYGYRNSVEMQGLSKNEADKRTDGQKDVVKHCTNNYVFFLSSRGRPEDNERVARVLPELEKITSDGRKIDRWYDYIDTLTWAKLHLSLGTAAQTTNTILELIKNKGIPVAWKTAAIERYRFYNTVHPDEEDVDIEVLKQNLEAISPSLAAETPAPEAAPSSPGVGAPRHEAGPPGPIA